MKLVTSVVVVLTMCMGLTIFVANKDNKSVQVNSAPQVEQTTDNNSGLGLTTQGKLGMKVNDNLCMDFTTGQIVLCF